MGTLIKNRVVWVVFHADTGVIAAVLELEALDAVRALRDQGFGYETASGQFHVGDVLPIFHE